MIRWLQALVCEQRRRRPVLARQPQCTSDHRCRQQRCNRPLRSALPCCALTGAVSRLPRLCRRQRCSPRKQLGVRCGSRCPDLLALRRHGEFATCVLSLQLLILAPADPCHLPRKPTHTGLPSTHCSAPLETLTWAVLRLLPQCQRGRCTRRNHPVAFLSGAAGVLLLLHRVQRHPARCADRRLLPAAGPVRFRHACSGMPPCPSSCWQDASQRV